MKMTDNPLHIVIVGAGFTGSALAANLYRYRNQPLQVTLIEKRLKFGLGEAYSTPFLYHLLNVRVKDMSAFEENLGDFTAWVLHNKKNTAYLDPKIPLEDQFVPRLWYGEYLQDLLKKMQNDAAFQLQLEQGEAINVRNDGLFSVVDLDNGKQIKADKVVFALGNGAPAKFSSAFTEEVHCLQNPWDFKAPAQIEKNASVMIVGTGLSMIDTVLTLYHQGHKGKIYALSRRGLVPLRHTQWQGLEKLEDEALPQQIKPLFSQLREITKKKAKQGTDWRFVINGFRLQFPALWKNANNTEKKRFLRHVLPYWNIHRHRVHDGIADLLENLEKKGQLNIISGRILHAEKNVLTIKQRTQKNPINYPVDWLINCMGPSMQLDTQNLLVKSLLQNNLATLDALNLGFLISENFAFIDSSGKLSTQYYSLGPPTKGVNWTCTSVPEIRRSCTHLAKHLLAI